ncbi:hypothetical protein JTB14_016622 [Gonioctena quinquepunctata]|nr:hypothetical protein JTB14_016622 [Gonioctena quinquepunctata]
MIIGITEGACYTALPMYIGEIASPDIRGFLSSLITTFFILGMLLVNALGSFLSIWTSSMISAIIPAIHFFSFLFMPESPYFYIKVKKYEQAERSLRIFQGTTVVAKEMEVIKGAVRMQEEMADSSKLTDLFTIPSNRRGMLIFIILSTSVRAAARAPLTSYNRFIFEESGSSISPRISAISNCAVELVVATFTTYFIIDRFGKRFLVIVSSAGCSVTLFIMGLYFYLKDFHNDVIDHLNWLPITTLISNNVMYNMGISFAVMCYLSELFPTNVKAKAMSFAQMYTVATAAATTKVFQIMNDRFGTLSVSFFCFSVFSMMMLFFIVKYVPETRGKTLEEIQLFLNEKHSARQDEKKTSEK